MQVEAPEKPQRGHRPVGSKNDLTLITCEECRGQAWRGWESAVYCSPRCCQRAYRRRQREKGRKV